MNPDKLLSKASVFPLTASRKFIKGLAWGAESKRCVDSWEDDPRTTDKWGVNTGDSGLFVLDCDEKKGKSGTATLAKMPKLPPTYTVKTPSGGFHYFFKGKGPTTANQLGDGLDTRGIGGMVKHYDEVVDDSEIAEIPDWIATWCRAHAEKSVERSGIEYTVDPDTEANLEGAVAFLKKALPAVEGEGGDTRTTNTAMFMHDHGISEEKALELMLMHWNERCYPPWDADELMAKIVSGYKSAKNDFGCRTADYRWEEIEELFSDVEAKDCPPIAQLAEDFSAESTKDEEEEEDDWVVEGEEEEIDEGPKRLSSLKPRGAPPREWLVKDYIPLNAVTSFYGAPGSGKSLATVDLCMCVATGSSWFGQRVDHPSPVLLVSCEDNEDELWRRADGIRLKEIHKAMAGAEDEVYYWDRVGKDSILATITDVGTRRKKFMDRLEEEIKKIAPEGERRTLIIDTLIDTAEMNENSRSHVNYFIKFILGGFAVRHNATVIFLAHPSKSSDVSGSTAFRGSVRAQLFLSKVEGQRDLRRITRGKANYSASEEDGEGGILIQWENGAFHNVDQKEFEGELRAVQKRAVFNVLLAATNAGNCIRLATNSRNPLKDHKILDEYGCEVPFENAKKLVNELINDGAVEESGNGLVATEF